MRRRKVAVLTLGPAALTVALVVWGRPQEQPAPATAPSNDADDAAFQAELARIRAEGDALDEQKRAEDAAMQSYPSAEAWEAAEHAKDAALEAQRHAATDAAIKDYDEAIIEGRARAAAAMREALDRQRAEDERLEAIAMAKELREREVAAQEEAAAAARVTAAAAVAQAAAAEEAARHAAQPRHVNCSTSYYNGGSSTTCN